MKLAAIDIGSNSVHMIVAGTAGDHSFEVLDREKEMVFLGRSVFEHGRLTDDAMASGLAAITKLHKLAQRHGVCEVRAVATAAVREAANGGEFLYAVAEHTGIAPQVISGTEEARYIYLAVRSAIDLSSRCALVIDIGGGSVELIAGDTRSLRLARSLKLGVQRLRARFGSEGLGKRERRALEDQVCKLAEPVIRSARDFGSKFAVGTSGTILALAQAAHLAAGGTPWTAATGQTVSLGALSALTQRLLALPAAERAAVAGIDAKRADSVHVGAVLLCKLLELGRLDELTLCDASLREGVVLDWLERRADSTHGTPIVSDIRRHSVRELARRCGQTGPHPERVAELCLALFDQTRELHRLGANERRLLEYAALLHDVGQHIGYERHEHHAAYIIKNGDLRGFYDQERSVIALLARYHRKSRPRRHDPDFAVLPARTRRAVRVLAAMLRLADGLDRSHHQVVRGLRCAYDDRSLVIRVETNGDAELELWGARRKAKLLERALRRKVEIELDGAQLSGFDLLHSA